MEKYLAVVDIRKYRIALSKFQCSSHDLSVESVRQRNVPYNLRFCIFCLKRGLNHIEDQFHVLLICPLYEELRARYHPQVRFGNISMFIKILSTKNVSRITELACYLFHCFNKRSLYLAGQI